MNRKKLAIILIFVGLVLSGCNVSWENVAPNEYNTTPYPSISNSLAEVQAKDDTEESSVATPEVTEGPVSDTEEIVETTPGTEDTDNTDEIAETEDTDESGEASGSESEEDTTTSVKTEAATTTSATTTTTTTAATTTTTTTAATTKTTTTTTKVTTTTTKAVTTTTTAATTTTTVSAEPSPPTIYATTADGKLTSATSQATIDYSNTSDGYVMAKYTGSKSKVRVVITYPNGGSYSYDLNANGTYEAFPLTGGNGTYSILVAENVSGTSYASAASCNISVNLSSSIAPYLRPSHMVDFKNGDVAVTKASQVCAGATTALQKIDRIYSWVVENVNYDNDLANKIRNNTVTSYLANPTKIINEKKGICYDYAVGIAAMLRSQGIPTQVVFGDVKNVGYHAWVNVYTPETGWVRGIIYFDGSSWKRMDATLASSNRNNDAIYDFINNNSNYYSVEKLY